jgi:hypothetical protein
MKFPRPNTASINFSSSGLEYYLSPGRSDSPLRSLEDTVPCHISCHTERRWPGPQHYASVGCFKDWDSGPHNMFGPSTRSVSLLCMSSADLFPSILSPLIASSHLSFRWHVEQISPGKCALTFTLRSAAYTPMLSVQILDIEDIRLLTQHDCLVCDFCSSNQPFACGCLQIRPQGSHLFVWLTEFPFRPAGDFHPRVDASCPATKKGGPQGPPFFLRLHFCICFPF